MVRPVSRLAAASVVALLFSTLIAGSPARAQEPPTLSAARIALADLDHRIAGLQARMGASLSKFNTWQARTLVAEEHLYYARLDARSAGLLTDDPEAKRLSMMSPPPLMVTFERALLRYQHVKRSRGYAKAGSTVDDFNLQIANLSAQRVELQAVVDRLSRVRSTGGGATYEGWARALLGALGAPDCQDNLLVVVAWQVQESTAARFNPLATTHSMPGATNFNSVGVKNYGSVPQGVQATVETLQNGSTSYGYGSVIDSLRACAPASATAQMVNASAWCRGCTGGAYLTGLLPIVAANYQEYAGRT